MNIAVRLAELLIEAVGPDEAARLIEERSRTEPPPMPKPKKIEPSPDALEKAGRALERAAVYPRRR